MNPVASVASRSNVKQHAASEASPQIKVGWREWGGLSPFQNIL
jgi:hypothetical protein